MGLFRKTASLYTLGLIDARSDKERIARSTRKTDKNGRKTNKLIAQQNKLIAEQGRVLIHPEQPSAPQRSQPTRKSEPPEPFNGSLFDV